jgi:uridine kinase
VDIQRVLDLIAAAAGENKLVLVGIGGRGAAGKTTLARQIPNAQLVTIDAFWDGQVFELERLLRQVIVPLRRGETARYEAWDWAERRPAGIREVEPRGTVVIDGVCALHTMFRDTYDIRVWVDTPRGARLERAVARDGEASRREWEERWMPSEDRYVERDDPVACAHLVVSNGETADPAG